jgi:Uma2 family endonuclease
MNEHVRPPLTDHTPHQPEPLGLPVHPRPRAATQAAEGLPRWRWTTDELIRMVEAGLLHPDERIELIGGEIVPMSPKGRRHEQAAEELAQYWIARDAAGVKISTERQFNLDEATYRVPDIIVRPSTIKTYDLTGVEALLVVEVAETSLAYDTGGKAKIYASFGVREYWVVNAVTLETRVHRDPTPEGYASIVAQPADTTLTPHLVPALAVRLADLDVA